MALTNNKNVLQWVDEMVALTKPAKVVWIDGSKEQLDALTEEVTSLPEGNHDKMYKLNPDKLPGCLAVTVRNTTYNLLKKEARDQKLFVPLHAQDLPDDGPTLEEQMLHSEALDELFTICDQLRPIDRELLLRYYLDDWKTPQLADHFGYQPGSVRVRLSRARRQVKQRMLESG